MHTSSRALAQPLVWRVGWETRCFLNLFECGKVSQSDFVLSSWSGECMSCVGWRGSYVYSTLPNGALLVGILLLQSQPGPENSLFTVFTSLFGMAVLSFPGNVALVEGHAHMEERAIIQIGRHMHSCEYLDTDFELRPAHDLETPRQMFWVGLLHSGLAGVMFFKNKWASILIISRPPAGQKCMDHWSQDCGWHKRV